VTFRLRFFHDGRLVIATDHKDLDEVARQFLQFGTKEHTGPVPEGSGQLPIHHTLAFRDQDGNERSATPEEEHEFRLAMIRVGGEGRLPLLDGPGCARCGLSPIEHEQSEPVLKQPDGTSVYFSCWTPEERSDLPPGFAGAS
jgi:hypothetical protein